MVAGLLVLFRGRSRHTYGFDSPFDLPSLELRALCGNSLRLEATGSPQLYWADGVAAEALTAACERAILVHAAYDVAASGRDLHAAAAHPCARPADASEFELIDLARGANVGRAERATALEALRAAFASAPPPQSAPARSWVWVKAPGGDFLGARLASGPAAGPGAPGADSSGRRNYKGWLGKFALKARHRAEPTTMEPELAFLMANLAQVGDGARVLDPCCGAGGLLLCAAALGAARVVGVDRAAGAFRGAERDFVEHALPPPVLVEGDVLNADATAELCAEYDALVCDPPYSMRAAALVDGAGDRWQRDASVELLRALLAVARRCLVPGGRLVCFVPARGADASLSLDALLEPLATAGLRLVDGRRQTFATRRARRGADVDVTFARWLVTWERVVDAAS